MRVRWWYSTFTTAFAILFGLLLGIFSTPLANAKLLPPLDVDMSLDGPLIPGGTATLSVVVTAKQPISNVVARWLLEGLDSPTPSAPIDLGDIEGGESRNVLLTVSLPRSGRGLMSLEISASDRAGSSRFGRTATLYTLAHNGTVRVSRQSFGVIEREIVAEEIRKAPNLAVARSLERSLGKGGIETAEPPTLPTERARRDNALFKSATGLAPGPLSATGTVRVHGQIRWTDKAGGTHPVPFARVEIRDEEVLGSELVTTVTTDANGTYDVTVNNDDGVNQNGRDIFIRVLSQSDAARVMRPEFLEIYFIDSCVRLEGEVCAQRAHLDVADGADLVINLTANNVDDNNTAFSIHHAAIEAALYVASIAGTMPASINIEFPSVKTVFSSSSLGSKILLLLRDRFDWDVIHHEYGHYVQKIYNLADSPGGPHDELNLAETRTKDAGLRLAWGEGWPTFFGTSLQLARDLLALGIPNVGDTRYQDTEDSTLNYDLESLAGVPSAGEDNEFSVQRILWDLYDASADMRDQVSLGEKAVWNTLVYRFIEPYLLAMPCVMLPAWLENRLVPNWC